MRVTLVTLGLAPVVTCVLVGLVKLEHDTPEWIFWKAELIFLIGVEIAHGITVFLATVGALILGALFFQRRGRGLSQPHVARGLVLCVALLCGFAVSEMVCARWLSWSNRFTAVPVGGFDVNDGAEKTARFAKPPEHINLRSNFPDPPGDRQIDVVVLGESSAEGVPYNRWLSIGKIVAWKLQEAVPGRPVRLNVMARSGDTLEKQHLMLSNLERRPDLLIIYCGHNEFYSRVWWARNIDHYFVDQRPGRWARIADGMDRFSPVRTLIRQTADRCRIAIPPPPATGRSLVDIPSFTATEYSILLTDFHRRLDELTSYAERIGALPVLILPPANDTGFEPNRSFLPPGAPPEERDAFGSDFLAARQLETANPAAAIERYRALIARQPCFAETHYRLAVLLESAGIADEAYREYAAARDLDGMPVRCPSAFQQAYREVAARHGCILIDGQSYFHAIGRHGLLDDELFQDAMHPSLRGQIALAQAVLVALRKRRAFGWPEDSPVPLVDPVLCAAHFGLDQAAWRRIALWEKGFNELLAPLRYDPSLRLRKREAGIAALAKIDAGTPPEAVGLPNLGIPRGIPLVEVKHDPTTEPAVIPCLAE
jgi:hypothetical protein